MIAESQVLTNADLDGLLADAVTAEAAGDPGNALGALTIAVAELSARSKHYQYLFEWMARLQAALGAFEIADRAALVGRRIAEAAGQELDAFRMDLIRADLARQELDFPRAQELLAGLRGDGPTLGSPTVDRIDEIIRWLRSLRFSRDPVRNVDVMRVELALTLAELWSEQGKYRSALALVVAIEPQLAGATSRVDLAQVRLLHAELALAAGELEAAGNVLAGIAEQSAEIDRVRVAVVRARVALARGQLAQVVPELPTLEAAPPGDPVLFSAAVATRVAFAAELNLLEEAQRTASVGIDRLVDTGAPHSTISLLERARSAAAARGASAMALWELPFVVARDEQPPRAVHEAPAPDRCPLATAWIDAANRVLAALERGELAEAAEHQTKLEGIARGIESEYVACRVELSSAIVAFYRGTASTRRFLAVADRLRAMGARLAEAQAVRFGAWAAAKAHRLEEYGPLVRRTSELVDEISAELDPERRAQFLMNKWSGRDEVVTAWLGELLRTAAGESRKPRRGELCRAFRDIHRLTHWSIDEALADMDAATLAPDADTDVVRAWVRARQNARADRSQRGISLPSPLNLWWFPARTVLLHYHVLPDRTYLFVIARRYIDVRILGVGRIHLAADMREAAADHRLLEWLATHTGIAEVMKRFRNLRRLVIVPHDAIANVPFAALPVDDKPLCATVPIVQLDRMTRFERRQRPVAHGTFLSAGRTSYHGSGFRDLPSAEPEATAVLRVLGARDVVHDDATREGVLAALSNAARFHVAAHGVFDSDQPLRSGIVLGDGRGGHETLTLDDIRRTDLQGLALATLATCRSAAHARLPGRERICFPTALLDAGAAGVIASLWPIEDEPSVEIMTALYEQLRTQPPAQALAAMQESMWRTRDARHWAGLVFYGNERRLQPQESTTREET